MDGHEAYIRLCEAAGLIDEAGLEEGRKTLGQKLDSRGQRRVANNVWHSANNRVSGSASVKDNIVNNLRNRPNPSMPATPRQRIDYRKASQNVQSGLSVMDKALNYERRKTHEAHHAETMNAPWLIAARQRIAEKNKK